jgi:hypothetical protein
MRLAGLINRPYGGPVITMKTTFPRQHRHADKTALFSLVERVNNPRVCMATSVFSALSHARNVARIGVVLACKHAG